MIRLFVNFFKNIYINKIIANFYLRSIGNRIKCKFLQKTYK